MCLSLPTFNYRRDTLAVQHVPDGVLLERPERCPPERIDDVVLKGGMQPIERGLAVHSSSSTSSGVVAARALRSTSVSSPSVRVRA